ncbi:MAG: hypothetical protein WAL67_00790 [Candidatus Cybelea sp.]
MSIARLGLQVLALCGVSAALGACGGDRTLGAPAMPAGTFAGKQQAGSTAGYSGDLLYIAHSGHHRFHGLLSVLTFPQGKLVSTISITRFATGICSDTSGNVWLIVVDHNRRTAYEYAHGGTTPITTLRILHSWSGLSCAVDPASGNLAIITGDRRGRNFADIYPGARKGKPASYPIPFGPTACTYDDSGNLFVDGAVGSTIFFKLAELPKGAHEFTDITLNKAASWYPGGMQWDGKYLALVEPFRQQGPSIYRIKISGSSGDVVGVVHLDALWSGSPLAIGEGRAVGTADEGNVVAQWRYPAGGKRIKTVVQYQYGIAGVAISAK